ncbi:hypothetical protein F544_18230 [Bibersteinia trehalosi USDA-ARS-USMARC-190]|uniref:Uncharacterized protein n=1 Tax=Bibersteinia trehalosi USDA-ARS-USMARC-190 TaxID=1263832 RepID=W0R8D7_BIBTR|nr:hypothetical protein F544_18230 [Bibersteinia trehalosi USDA-ARS-USMARC-190]
MVNNAPFPPKNCLNDFGFFPLSKFKQSSDKQFFWGVLSFATFLCTSKEK